MSSQQGKAQQDSNITPLDGTDEQQKPECGQAQHPAEKGQAQQGQPPQSQAQEETQADQGRAQRYQAEQDPKQGQAGKGHAKQVLAEQSQAEEDQAEPGINMSAADSAASEATPDGPQVPFHTT